MTSSSEGNKQELQKELEALKKQNEQLEKKAREANARAEAANHLKAMFLTNISHEIRTPMNGILGMYNVLRQTNLSSEQREFLDIINISGQNLLSIIDDIIDLSKIESGQIQLEAIEFNLKKEMERIIELLSIKARGKGIELISEVDPTTQINLIGDAGRLKQIITNLANNAIKYTKEGSVKIKVEPVEQTDQSSKLKFSIIDTGIGISEEGKQKLFKAFSQIDSSSTRKYGGTGLGLAIAKNLSKIMQGDIGVESELGKGSTFWFTAKFSMAPNAGLGSTAFHTDRSDGSDKLHILLVEDNLLNQKFATASLRKVGHKVDIAENGKAAVEKYQKNEYDLILMDIQMPVMDGIEATKKIRIIEKEKEVDKPIKIIAITAYVMERDRKMCLRAGMDEYLAKPFKPQELISLINKVYYGQE
ncbi:MAG: response regulator [Bacteroidales bacterium]|nr:response regulator [Bacteroidales bacterium]MCF8343763.1 response regulator [Bacteroidales bacterium]MCF8351628.1 response regulator [Bacteroidales bacterium]MCF8375244.1 response regulator [Bacteroidales bacterium]MCF8400268.1 response regulator [Bacteroidales bacterium]